MARKVACDLELTGSDRWMNDTRNRGTQFRVPCLFWKRAPSFSSRCFAATQRDVHLVQRNRIQLLKRPELPAS